MSFEFAHGDYLAKNLIGFKIGYRRGRTKSFTCLPKRHGVVRG